MASRLIDEPNWFAAVMGTGALAAVLAMNPGDVAAATAVTFAAGAALLVASAAFFVFLFVRGLVSGQFRHGLLDRVMSPITGPHYATFPGAVNVLAVSWLRLFPDAAMHPWSRWLVLAMAAAGTAMGLWLTVVFFAGTFQRDEFEAESISGTWFIPETVILLGALLFAQLAATAPLGAHRSLAVLALALLGIGTLLFALTAAVFFNRLVLHRQASERGAPAMWIMLSPLSVAALAIGLVADKTRILGGNWGAAVHQTADFVAALLWGFSLWWVAVAVVLTVGVGRAALTRTPADWGYVFPTAALSLSTLTLADAWRSGLMQVLGTLFAALLVAIWLTVLVSAVTSLLRERRRHPAVPG